MRQKRKFWCAEPMTDLKTPPASLAGGKVRSTTMGFAESSLFQEGSTGKSESTPYNLANANKVLGACLRRQRRPEARA